MRKLLILLITLLLLGCLIGCRDPKSTDDKVIASPKEKTAVTNADDKEGGFLNGNTQSSSSGADAYIGDWDENR